MSILTDAMLAVLDEQNVNIQFNSPVESFDIINDMVSGALTRQKDIHADIFISTMDYQYTEHLLPKQFRNYHEKYWNRRLNRSSVLIFFLGIDAKLDKLVHHNLIFEDFFEKDSRKYSTVEAGKIMHVCCASKTEDCAPKGMENVVVRMKVPDGLEDTGKMRELFFTRCISRLEQITNQKLEDKIVVKKSFSMTDFENDYNAYRGTFDQSHLIRKGFFKNPLRIKNRHLKNFYYGELQGVLGPGIPSSILNGEALANQIYTDEKD
jgi:phytoene desaturase